MQATVITKSNSSHLDAQFCRVVGKTKPDLCGSCGSVMPRGMSCDCFDNGQ